MAISASLPSRACERRLTVALLAGLPFFIAGCSVGPDYVQPAVPLPTATNYKELGNWKPAQPKDDVIRGKWWEMYHDAQLDALEDKVDISNQNVLQAEAQFRDAAAAVKVARADFFPTITTDPAYTLSQASQNTSSSSGGRSGSTGSVVTSSSGTGSGIVIGGSSSQHVGATTVNLFSLPVETTYLVDIWGSVRRNVESESATAQASYANLENIRLTYQATLAEDYFNMLGLDAEAQVLQMTVDSYAQYLQMTQNRYNSGIASQADVAQAQTQLDTTRAQLIDVGVERAVYEHALATLTGQPATDFGIGKKPLVGVPPPTPIGVPSELLERRPDVAEAERQMAAANAQIGVQVAGYYPQLTINASTGLESIKLSDLFQGPSFLWSVGPVLAQTLFDAGRTHGLVQEAQANYDATVANYRQTVLTSIQQVEDALAGLRILEDEAAAEDRAVKSAKISLDVTTNEYKAGTVDYLSVITTQAIALSDEVQAVNIQTRRMTTSVQLVAALGGGWDTAKLASPRGVADVPQAQAEIAKEKK